MQLGVCERGKASFLFLGAGLGPTAVAGWVAGQSIDLGRSCGVECARLGR